jgi:nitroimidazol reductase NimA-like FMN-containing flavoprotein (pyridoxamine 5'-phosphate oxidase superfamily)
MRTVDATHGFGAPLTLDEAKNFLTISRLNVHIGTIDAKGYPNIHPTWYYFDESSNNIYFATSKHSKKIANLKGNPLVYFCIDDPNPPYKGVRGKGKARIIQHITDNISIVEKIMLKYLGSLDHQMARTLVELVRKGEEVVIEINPEYFSTWDYGKIS